ncbi:LysR family transcriptional regulator [Caldimonas brevitalea]|uniref:LysR family transcriptional regulator n=1 Tax=Caldimonas brevitalea TaxID=413882 RepID=A0A0G3BVK0_9BURK|nr:LysR family transcriptional regulator [Caldimonas brevitalea]AKJ31396.1 LysR family transcriptional regulator [Caldimonas brevitalea]
MTFTQLQVFATLAEARNFSRAATLLGITQSAVSHALRGLERELGVSLFSRDRLQPELTAAGRRLLARAHEIGALHEALIQEAKDARGLNEGVLRIGSFGFTSSLRILPDLLVGFQARHPGIEVYIDEDDDETVVRWLAERRVEIGFVVLPDERFETLALVEDEFVVLVPEGHPLATQATVSAADLDGQPFVMTEAGCAELIQALLDAAGARPRILYRFPQLLSILGFVARGLAISVAARLALPDDHPGIVYRSLTPRAPRRVGLAVRDSAQLSPAARAFVELAREMYGRRTGRRLEPLVQG